MSDNSTLKKLQVIIEGTIAPYKRAINEARSETRRAAEDIGRETQNMSSRFNMNSVLSKIRSVQEAIRGAVADCRARAGFTDEGLMSALGGTISEKFKNAQLKAGLKEHTNEYKQLQADADRAAKAIEKLKQKQQNMDASGVDHQSTAWKNVCNQISAAERRLGGYTGAMRRMEGTGRDVQFVGFKAIGAAAFTKTMNGMKAVLSGVTTAIKRTSGVFGALIKKFASGTPIVKRFTNGVHQNGNAFKGGLKNILKYAFGIRSLYMLVNKLRNALKEGFKNLAQYDDQTNASLSAIMSSLTQFKNSMATAFAPILNVVAPILVTLINYLTKAATALAHFFASFTGQSSVVVSKKVNQDYAASLNANASSADKADKANKKLKNTLMGFDQINKLDDNSDSDSDSSSGGLSPSDMFETTGIDSNVSNFVRKVKEAWNNADFTEIGEILGSKLNDALNSIPWAKIKETSRKIARSIATFLNGFLGKTDWGLVGSTIADGINTGIEFAYTFVTTFDWKKFGKAFADGINGFVKKIDWKKSAQTLSEGLKGLLDTLIAAVKNIDWYQICENIKIFLENIDWVGIVERIAELFGAACGGLAALLGGLLGDAFSATGKYFEDKAAECGGNMVLGILKGIVDGLINISVWIVEHIFLPIINGFKDAFGIHSPSTVMAEQGGYIIEGLLKGLIDNVGKVIKWVISLPGKIIDALGNAKDWLFQKGKDAIEGFKSGFESCKEGIKSVASKIPGLIREGVGNLWDLGKNAISSFVSGFTSVNIPTPKISTVTGAVSSKIPKVNVKQYASGGQPGIGEMFIARESGPELVGKIGNKSSVANNGQIIEGIKAGVFEAVLDAFDAANTLFGGSNSGEKPVVVEFTFMCGEETIYKMSKKGKEKYEGRVSIVERV